MINNMDTSKVNRVEVIDWTKYFEDGGGRVYVKWGNDIKIKLELQDQCKTLKIFIQEETNNK